MSFCAICVGEAGPFVQRPLGKDGALVTVCQACDEDPPIADDGPDRGYEEREAMSAREMLQRIASFATEVDPLYGEYAKGAVRASNRERTPGWILVRLRRRDALGKSCDLRDVIQRIRHEPWFAEARYLGSDKVYFLLERPDPKIAAESRKRSENPLVDLLELAKR